LQRYARDQGGFGRSALSRPIVLAEIVCHSAIFSLVSPLAPGTAIGVYRLEQPLGEGGPPPLARDLPGELRRDLAVGKELRCR
jgi:hypothetical protein